MYIRIAITCSMHTHNYMLIIHVVNVAMYSIILATHVYARSILYTCIIIHGVSILSICMYIVLCKCIGTLIHDQDHNLDNL